MIGLIELSNAVRDKLRAIPELVNELGGEQEAISAYIDFHPEPNSVSAAVYEMAPGSVLVVWQDTTIAESDMEGWEHRVQVFARSAKGKSPLVLLNWIVDGIPVPGDGMPWRMCGVMSGVLPPTVSSVTRLIDEEGIDYLMAEFMFRETGDSTYGS